MAVSVGAQIPEGHLHFDLETVAADKSVRADLEASLKAFA